MSPSQGFKNGLLRKRKKELLFLLLCAALPLCGVFPQPASGWVMSFPLVGIYLAAAYLAGKAVLSGLDLFDDNPPLHGIIRILTGFAVFSLYMEAIGLLGLARHLIPAYLILAAVLFLYHQIRKHTALKKKENPKKSKKADAKTKKEETAGGQALINKPARIAIICAVVVCLAALLLLAPIPEGFHDSLLYHLALPQQMFLTGRLAPMEHNFTTFLPLGSEMLYVPLAANDYSARLLQFAFAIMTLGLVVFSFPRRYRPVAALISITAFGFFEFTFTSVTTLPEMNTAVYALAGWLLAEKFPGSGKKSLLIAAGFMFGIAAGIKYQGLVLAATAALALFILLLIKKHGFLRSFLPPVILLIITVAAFSPWMIRGFILTGNPVFPAANQIFQAKNISPEDASLIMTIWGNAAAGVKSIAGFFLTPLRSAMTRGGAATLVLLLLPALFLLFRKKEKTLGPLIIISGFYIIWFLWAPDPRYFVPAVPFILLASIRGVDCLSQYRKIHLVFATVLAALFVINFVPVLVNLYGNLKPFDFYSSGFDRAAYHEKLTTSPFAAFNFINENTPTNAKILLIGESRGYNLKRPYHASSPYERQLISDYLSKNGTESELAAALKKDGYSYIVVNFAEWRRTRDFLKIPAMNFAPKGSKEGYLLLELFRTLKMLYQDKNCVVYAL